MRAIEIYWLDAQGDDGWLSRKEVEKQHITLIHTVGLLVSETKDHIAVTLADDPENENVGAYMVIPKFAIKKKRYLK